MGGIRSVLQSQESEEYMRHVASRADSMLRAVKHENTSLSTDKAAVLALINAVDRLQKYEMRQDHTRDEAVQLQKKVESLEAALQETTTALKAAETYLEDYEARDDLLEAGLIPLSSSKNLAGHIRQTSIEFDEEEDPDQLSFTELVEVRNRRTKQQDEQRLQTDMIENIYARKGMKR